MSKQKKPDFEPLSKFFAGQLSMLDSAHSVISTMRIVYRWLSTRKVKGIKVISVLLSACFIFIFCKRDTLPLYSEGYSSAFQADGRFFIKDGYLNHPYPDTASISELLPETNETKLIACGLHSFHYNAGRLWRSEGNVLYSRPLEGGDWQLELIKEDYLRVRLTDIIGDKWLLYGNNWKRPGDDDYIISYTVLDRKTGEETLICEVPVSKWGCLYGWNGEQLLCVMEGKLCRIRPEGCEIIAEILKDWWQLQAGLLADGTAYWVDENDGQLEIFWQEDGEKSKSAKFTLPQYQYFRKMYLTEEGQVMLFAQSRKGQLSLYRFIPENGKVAVIFANMYLGNVDDFFFDEENYYYVDCYKEEFKQGPLDPLYYLPE
ncbi:MAG: hypothetical protein HFE45_03580 [Oscillospiraceae bacterium]|nr:hypothetical protein [Oscillospiraceae bacterium]